MEKERRPELKGRNHFIPKTYLEKFLNNENKLFVYKKGESFFKDNLSKKDRFFAVKGRGGLNVLAVKNRLYIPDGDLVDDRNMFEDFFSEEIESKYNEFIDFVKNNFFNAPAIFAKYRNYIILLIASMMSRTLHSKKEIEEMYKINLQMYNRIKSNDLRRSEKMKKYIKDKFPETTDEEAESSIKKYLEDVEKGEFDINIPRNLFIKYVFENMEMYSGIISNMTIQILQSNNPNYFITTDAPVVYFVPKGKENFYFSAKSLGGPNTELYFPLTKTLCLLLTRRNTEVLSGVPVDSDIVDAVNYNLSHNSRDFIYSPFQNSQLEKFIDNYHPYPFKFKLE